MSHLGNNSSQCDSSQPCPSPRLGYSTEQTSRCRTRLGRRGTCVLRCFGDRAAELGAMKALQAACIVGAIAFTVMIHQVSGNPPGATVPRAMPQAAVSAE